MTTYFLAFSASSQNPLGQKRSLWKSKTHTTAVEEPRPLVKEQESEKGLKAEHPEVAFFFFFFLRLFV